MAAGTPTHSFFAEDFAEPFLSGEYDSQIHETSNPMLTGKFWPWVKKRQAMQKGASDAARLQRAIQDAEASAAVAEEELAQSVAGRMASCQIRSVFR